MIYNRLDGQCRAKVLAANGDKILMRATWLARGNDFSKFKTAHGIAENITVVSRNYFVRNYGRQPKVY
jgi:hypothetical protein